MLQCQMLQVALCGDTELQWPEFKSLIWFFKSFSSGKSQLWRVETSFAQQIQSNWYYRIWTNLEVEDVTTVVEILRSLMRFSQSPWVEQPLCLVPLVAARQWSPRLGFLGAWASFFQVKQWRAKMSQAHVNTFVHSRLWVYIDIDRDWSSSQYRRKVDLRTNLVWTAWPVCNSVFSPCKAVRLLTLQALSKYSNSDVVVYVPQMRRWAQGGAWSYVAKVRSKDFEDSEHLESPRNFSRLGEDTETSKDT